MRRASRLLPILLTAVALAGCGDANMYSQKKVLTWDRNDVLPNKTAMQLPVVGTVPRDEPNQAAPQPQTITAALVERGHQQYDIFCTPCHGLTGAGDGMIVQRGFPHPPRFTDDALMKAKAQHFYDVMTDGKGAMYSYADRVTPADRWAVAAYIRALQLSQKPVVADLSADDKFKIDKGIP